MTLKKKALENTVEKGENVFSTISKTVIIILATFNLPSANAFNLVMPKILSFGKRGNL